MPSKPQWQNIGIRQFRFYPLLTFYMLAPIWQNNQLVDGDRHQTEAEAYEKKKNYKSLWVQRRCQNARRRMVSINNGWKKNFEKVLRNILSKTYMQSIWNKGYFCFRCLFSYAYILFMVIYSMISENLNKHTILKLFKEWRTWCHGLIYF